MSETKNKSLWKQRNFILMWSGQLVSWMGTEVSGIALPLVVLALTGSPARAGSVAAIRGLVFVIWSIPAGVLVDRWDRKTVMFVANLGSGLAMGSIALALFYHRLTLPELYIACAIESSLKKNSRVLVQYWVQQVLRERLLDRHLVVSCTKPWEALWHFSPTAYPT